MTMSFPPIQPFLIEMVVWSKPRSPKYTTTGNSAILDSAIWKWKRHKMHSDDAQKISKLNALSFNDLEGLKRKNKQSKETSGDQLRTLR